MSTKIPFTRRLKEARTRKGLSQKKLGILAGIDEFSASVRMNQYEKGTHSPDLSLIEKISRALDIPTAYLFAEEDDIAELILIFSKKSQKAKKGFIEKLKIQE
tara:strand:+ start:56 stop:364 length:309 start_codon:yes stop_codon:yes gene_type:complete